MLKQGLVDSAVNVLEGAGFKMVQCEGSRSSFDVIARRQDSIILVKALANVEGLSRQSASELKKMAQLIGGVPIVISQRMKSSDLAPGTVYDRYGVVVCDLYTFRQIIDEKSPRAYAKRGSYCVHVDGRMLCIARKRLGMTQESLARDLGVSKQSVYRYESSSSVSLEVFERMVSLFGDDFAKSEFKLSFKSQNPKTQDTQNTPAGIKGRAKTNFESMGFKTSLTNAPFDIIASKKKIVYSVVSNDWRRLEMKLKTLSGLGQVLEGYTMCITDRKVDSETTHMTPDELSRIKDARELFKLLSQR